MVTWNIITQEPYTRQGGGSEHRKDKKKEQMQHSTINTQYSMGNWNAALNYSENKTFLRVQQGIKETHELNQLHVSCLFFIGKPLMKHHRQSETIHK